jgi:hypothetical protein
MRNEIEANKNLSSGFITKNIKLLLENIIID